MLNRLLTLAIALGGLAVGKLDVGFAAGFCGGGDYYCDHYHTHHTHHYHHTTRTY